MGKILGIVPCTKGKIWDTHPNIGPISARLACTEPVHHVARAYVESFTSDWVILSAKYGFLCPHDLISGFYDVTFDRPHDPYVSIKTLEEQIENMGLNRYDKLIVTCSKNYVDKIRTAFFKYPNIGLWCPTEHFSDDALACRFMNQHLLARDMAASTMDQARAV